MQVLDRNRIKSLDPSSLAGLTALRELRMESNNLRSLSHLGHLVSLRCLHLGSNRISECSELDKLTDTPSIVELSLAGSPLSRKPGYRPAVLVRLGRLQVRRLLPCIP
jgi:Leucine-rich repeat (LRR) protein